METKKFIYYQKNDMWVGWLEEYSDYRTQGATLDELKDNLKDIYADLSTGEIPHVRKSGELMIWKTEQMECVFIPNYACAGRGVAAGL